MKVVETSIPGLLIIEPQVFGDDRGYFMETWQKARYAGHGLPETFVQDNQAFSRRGVLRGLHAQHPNAQGKLVQIIIGAAFDVAVDIRVGSPWFGRWVGVELSAENKRQLYVPPGFAHGYYVQSEEALMQYKCTELYDRESEFGLRWDDQAIGIEWPLDGEPSLSAKDRSAPLLDEVARDRLPLYTEG